MVFIAVFIRYYHSPITMMASAMTMMGMPTMARLMMAVIMSTPVLV
jgi:hypothetical protein